MTASTSPLSHETAGVFREYERCATTIVDAALSPLLRRYLERLAERAVDAGPARRPRSCCRAAASPRRAVAARHGSWTVLSGPAGGAVGAAAAARETGARRRSASTWAARPPTSASSRGGRARESGGREVAGRALALPMVDVHTVGAGGGSIAWRDAGGALRVGPQSAGAVPGPACYGRGGTEPTVTDANLLLGHLDPDVAAGGRRRARPRRGRARGRRRSPASSASASVETAEGILRVANAEMAAAVRVMTVERGIDPRELALLAFGGAGPMHGAAVADELGMQPRASCRAASGVLSALGMVVSERRVDVVDSVLLSGDGLTDAGRSTTPSRGWSRGARERARHRRRRGAAVVRRPLRGPGVRADGATETAPDALRRAFDAAHEERYGYARPGRRDRARHRSGDRRAARAPRRARRPARARRGRVDGPGDASPLDEATLVVPEGWSAARDGDGAWLLEREA